MGPSLLLVGEFKIRLLQGPLKAAPSGSGRPRASEKQAVFTPVTRKKEEARAKPQTSQQLLGGSGRRGAVGRWKRRERARPWLPGKERLTLPGRCPGWRRRCRAPQTAFLQPPRKTAEPEPETCRPAEPAGSLQPQVRGGQVLQASARAGCGPGLRTLSPERLRERSGSAYLARSGRPRWAWLRGPGRNWLPEEGPAIRRW